jgi:hypothetical protein
MSSCCFSSLPLAGSLLCVWEKGKRKSGVLIGQCHSWPLASRRVGCKLWILYIW